MTIDFIEFCDLFASFALGESLNTKTAASECCLGRFCTFSRPGTCFAQILSTGNLADFRKFPWKFNRPPWISISRNQPTKSRISIERPNHTSRGSSPPPLARASSALGEPQQLNAGTPPKLLLDGLESPCRK